MRSSYQLKIITPEGIAYMGDVVHTSVPVENGSVGVLTDHITYVTASPGGSVKISEKAFEEKAFLVGAGLFTISDNQATFLTRSCKISKEKEKKKT